MRDGILTLPAALAIRDASVVKIFRKPRPTRPDLRTLAGAFHAVIPEAERYLDEIASEACSEAKRGAPNPAPLLALVDRTRQLSQR